ncbi:hypothetical protein AGMMS49574_02200 [Bacteroidia bacterium]|nr:hypothetical protein AGMMS49574_02200 [Bacteroidia bacterium]
MWKKYFPYGKIVSLDIYDKSALQENRIKIYQGSQVDLDVLSRIVDENGPFDLIIDDGSHVNNHIITTFQYLFPKLKEGGIYVIEDIQTSYWKSMGGDNENFNNPETAMNFCKRLTDSLNYSEFNIKGYQYVMPDGIKQGLNFDFHRDFRYSMGERPRCFLKNLPKVDWSEKLRTSATCWTVV